MKQLSLQYLSVVTRWFKAHRRLAVAGLVCLLVVGIAAGCVVYSVIEWRSASDSIEHTNSTLRSQSQELLRAKAQPSIQDVRTFESKVNVAAASICSSIAVLKWQTNLSAAARNIEDRCQKTRSNVADISTSAHAVIARIEKENNVTKILVDTDKKLQTVKANDFKSTIEIWHTTREKILKMDVDESLQKVKKQTMEVIQGIEAALGKLVKANQEKNRAAFDDATAEVEKAYSKLSSIQNMSVDSFTELIVTLTKSTQKLEG